MDLGSQKATCDRDYLSTTLKRGDVRVGMLPRQWRRRSSLRTHLRRRLEACVNTGLLAKLAVLELSAAWPPLLRS